MRPHEHLSDHDNMNAAQYTNLQTTHVNIKRMRTEKMDKVRNLHLEFNSRMLDRKRKLTSSVEKSKGSGELVNALLKTRESDMDCLKSYDSFSRSLTQQKMKSKLVARVPTRMSVRVGKHTT